MPEVLELNANVRQRVKRKGSGYVPNKLIEPEVDEAADWNFRIDEILAKIQVYQDGRFAQPGRTKE